MYLGFRNLDLRHSTRCTCLVDFGLAIEKCFFASAHVDAH